MVAIDYILKWKRITNIRRVNIIFEIRYLKVRINYEASSQMYELSLRALAYAIVKNGGSCDKSKLEGVKINLRLVISSAFRLKMPRHQYLDQVLSFA